MKEIVGEIAKSKEFEHRQKKLKQLRKLVKPENEEWVVISKDELNHEMEEQI